MIALNQINDGIFWKICAVKKYLSNRIRFSVKILNWITHFLSDFKVLEGVIWRETKADGVDELLWWVKSLNFILKFLIEIINHLLSFNLSLKLSKKRCFNLRQEINLLVGWLVYVWELRMMKSTWRSKIRNNR